MSKTLRPCEYCGTPTYNKRFCSHSCRGRSRKGCKLSEEHKRNISKAVSGDKNPFYGKCHTDESKKLMSESKSGENHPMYGKHLSEETKTKLRQSCKERETNLESYLESPVTYYSPDYRKKAIEYYGHVCESCGETRSFMEVHHLDGNHENDDIENLIVLCRYCHKTKAHINRGRGLGFTLNKKFSEEIIESRKSE